MRAFIAIDLPEGPRAALDEEIRRLRGAGARATWVRPEHLHLTLRFLGEITPDRKELLAEELARVCAEFTPLRLAMDGLGAFPNLRRPAVVWAGVRVIAGELNGLQRAVEDAVRRVGFGPDDKAFHPHVTLCRIRDLAASSSLIRLLCERSGEPGTAFGDEFQTSTVALFRSDLKPGGPVHTRLEEFFLTCGKTL